MATTLETVDWIVITTYFLFVLVVGILSSLKSQRDSVAGHFLARRSMHFIPVGASMFACNIGTSHFVGLAGTAARSGIGTAMFEIYAVFFILMLGWLFVPVYMASGVYTMPEYMRRRFGGKRISIYLSVLSILLYIFTKISADLYAGALFITRSFSGTLTLFEDENHRASMYIAIMILLAITSVFTILGGLSAVIWTDLAQSILIIIGAVIVTTKAFNAVGGYEKLVERYASSAPNVTIQKYPGSNDSEYCNQVPEKFMHLIRPPNSDLPWTGVIFGLSISHIWYFCTDQDIVQHVLAAKNIVHAKGGCVLLGYFKLLPLWIMVIPGMASRALFPNEVGCSNPDRCEEICDQRYGCTNLAFIKLVTEYVPSGLRGFIISVMLAALTSSLSSIFNSSSTIFTVDIYRVIRPDAREYELLVVGRLAILVLVAISLAWIPVMTRMNDAQLFEYIQSVTSYLCAPICAVFLLAIFWKNTTETGAFWGLMIGLFAGMTRFVLEISYQHLKPECGSEQKDKIPQWWYKVIGNIHYLHFALILWGICTVITIAISLVTTPLPKERIYRLTFWSRWSTNVRKDTHRHVNERRKKQPYDKEGVPLHCNAEKSRVRFRSTLPTWRRIVYIVCGFDGDEKDIDSNQSYGYKVGPKTDKEKAKEAVEALHEPDHWQRFLNINAVVLMTITCFVIGFYW